MTRGGLGVRAMQRRTTRTAVRPSQDARRRSAQSRPGHLRQAKNRRDSQRQSGAWVHGGRARRVSEHRKVHHREQTRSPGRRRTDDAGQPSKRDGRRGGASRHKSRRGRRALQGKQTSREASGWSSTTIVSGGAQHRGLRDGNGRTQPDRRSQLDPQCPRLLRIPRNRMQAVAGRCAEAHADDRGRRR